jgi:hypothetical protein
MNAKVSNKAKGKGENVKAKGQADKVKACKFPRAVLVAMLKADGAADQAGLAALRAGIGDKVTPDLLQDVAREVGRVMPPASAKVRASEINTAGKAASYYGAALAGEIIGKGATSPGGQYRGALAALRTCNDAAKAAGDKLPKGAAKLRTFISAALKAAADAADALKAKRAAALAAGKGKASGAEGNVFPIAPAKDKAEGRARLVTHRATFEAIQRDMAAIPAAAFASKERRTYLLEGLDTLLDLLRDAIPAD